MMYLKKLVSWFVAFAFFVFAGVKLVLDYVGRSTFKDDLDQLMTEQLPEWQAWLFTTPWWAPAMIGLGLALFLVWLNWPQSVYLTGPIKNTPDIEVSESVELKAQRKKIIDSARGAVLAEERKLLNGTGRIDLYGSNFSEWVIRQDWFYNLKPHLQAAKLTDISATNKIIVNARGGGIDPKARMLLDEISRIESLWFG
jgi:hypothetical protein